MARRNATLRNQLDGEAGRKREALVGTIVSARGGVTEITTGECGSTIDATGPVTAGPGESVTTIRPQDRRGRTLPGATQALPDQAVSKTGGADFPGTRRSSTGDTRTLAAAIPELAINGETTETIFVGTNLTATTVIVAVDESGAENEEVTLDNFVWLPDPQAVDPDIADGYDAIQADVTVAPTAHVGDLIWYAFA